MMFNDNFQLGLGTTKTSDQLQGYGGFMPVNKTGRFDSNSNDPYSKFGKANHMLTYHVRVPGYKGYISSNPGNLKGNPRPYCLSTKGEMMN